MFRGDARQIGVGKVGVARCGRETRIWLERLWLGGLCLLVNNPFVKHTRAAALDGLDWLLNIRLDLEWVFLGGGVWLVVRGHFNHSDGRKGGRNMREENKERVQQTEQVSKLGLNQPATRQSTNIIYSVYLPRYP